MNTSFTAAYDLTGQVALLTGASGGIGTAVAELFAERGCRLVLVDRNPAGAALAARLGPQHIHLTANASDEASVCAAVAQAIAQTGRIDILVNNAGIALLAKAEDTTAAQWDQVMDINLRGCFLYAREVGRHMLVRGYGRIINMASQAATVGLDQHLAYCTSKAGLLGMTRVLALEWSAHGITTNAISPTVVETELGRKAWAGEAGVAFKKKIPTGRFAQPEEVAQATLYLASGAAGMLSGMNLALDGGYTAI